MTEHTPSALICRNVTVFGKRTCIRLERQMWMILKEVAAREACSIHELVSRIATRRPKDLTLSSAVRLFLLLYFREASTEDGHIKAGHGFGDSLGGLRSRAGTTGEVGQWRSRE